MSDITKQTISALDEALTLDKASTQLARDQIQDILLSSKFLDKEISPPGKCPEPGCDGFCRTTEDDDEITVECLQSSAHNRTLNIESYTGYRISFRSLLNSLADQLDTEIVEYTESLPRYVEGQTAVGYRFCLIVSPGDFESTVTRICREAVEKTRPTLLITPTESTERIHKIQSLFAAGQLVTATPLTMFTDPEIIQEAISAMQGREFFRMGSIEDEVDTDTHDVVERLAANPAYTIAELNQIRMLRVSKQLPRNSGTRLEKVSEAAFSHLFSTYLDAGGEDDSGFKLPDILFRIPAIPKAHQEDEILGVADSKSGRNGNFGSEKVDEKHPRYLQRARRDGPESDLHAHVFVVLGFDGQKELDFYDKMKNHYTDDEYMIIVTAEALATMLMARFAYPIHNKLQLQRNDFRSVLYPLFHRDWFNGDDTLAELTRQVGQGQDEYDRKYYTREGLLILTRGVVMQQLINHMDMDGDLERDLAAYFEPLNYQPP